MIHVQRNGTILRDGEEIGVVIKVDSPLIARMGKWRAEVGDPANPETYKVAYANTRQAAVREVAGDE